jgi:uncharacterized protein involved in response to NO
MTSFFPIEEPPASTAPGGFALWALGFRPFYLLAAGFAAISILLWALQFTGHLSAPYLSGPLWHAHEMLFGFAVIVGFLFTAGRSWSGQPTPTGGKLAALAVLWVAGRVLVLTPYGWLAAIVNAAFPLAAAIALAIPFWKGRNKRNYFFVGLLVLMACATLAVHLTQLGAITLPAFAGIQVGLDIVLFILCVMGGRVIPMFTINGVPGVFARRDPRLEQVALGSVLALLAADALQAPAMVIGVIAAIAGLAHLARWLLWKPWQTLRVPIVWVLHLAYLWIPLHLAMRACAAAGLVGTSPATHALTVGAVGGLIIGMITRTARGHTARPLRADWRDVSCYVLVALAAFVRVFGPLLSPENMGPEILVSAVLWSLAFGLYCVAYWNVLTRPRLDGKPG